MTNLGRRLKKLEAVLTDTAGLVSGSPRWFAYWTERIGQVLSDEEPEPGDLIPLEVLDAILLE